MTDLFCGAGGSSTGATQVPGVSVRMAANHWALAVETHNENHPDADHQCADLSQVEPALFPRTDILWASPECTNHSVAKGIKRQDAQPDLFGQVLPSEAAERSRATMWDVPRFTEYHQYKAVIVENVVDAWHWPPFQNWLGAMDSYGYAHKLVFLNSMHAQAGGDPAPQSRDRMYVVFWLRGNPEPDLEAMQRPAATCPSCGPVRAMQSWKNPDKPRWGRYRAQYLYRCPNVSCRNQVLEPDYLPASTIIDWAHQGKRIGDRTRPLSPKTVARIQAGIDRYWRPLLVPTEGRDGKAAQSVDHPLRTQTTRNETGVAFIAELRGGGSTARSVADPLCTVTASGNHHGLVMRNNTGGAEMTTPTSEPVRTVTTHGHQSLMTGGPTIDVDDVMFRMLEPAEIKRAMAFPADYVIRGTKREQVRMSGNAVTPPAARDLISAVAESLRVA